jgi:hypothetical protein
MPEKKNKYPTSPNWMQKMKIYADAFNKICESLEKFANDFNKQFQLSCMLIGSCPELIALAKIAQDEEMRRLKEQESKYSLEELGQFLNEDSIVQKLKVSRASSKGKVEKLPRKLRDGW